MVHTPLFASENFKGKSKDGILGDAIEELDWSVGQIMKTLDDLKLADNTLLIFTSDNGPATDRADGLRGKKTSTFEGGVLVPTIMRWPGKIPANTVTDQITSTVDILPTIAKLTGSKLDPTRPIDGADISTLLFDADPKPVRDVHLYYGRGAGNLEAIRQGPWKLFLGAEKRKTAPQKKRGRQAQPEHSYLTSLYNLEKDPAETTDLSSQNPEVLTKLTALARSMDADVRSNPRPIGK
jgi:arylsulfatase A-like enzyme